MGKFEYCCSRVSKCDMEKQETRSKRWRVTRLFPGCSHFAKFAKGTLANVTLASLANVRKRLNVRHSHNINIWTSQVMKETDQLLFTLTKKRDQTFHNLSTFSKHYHKRRVHYTVIYAGSLSPSLCFIQHVSVSDSLQRFQYFQHLLTQTNEAPCISTIHNKSI